MNIHFFWFIWEASCDEQQYRLNGCKLNQECKLMHNPEHRQTHTHTESVFSVIWEAEILLCCGVLGKKKKMLSSCLRLYVFTAFNIAFFVFGLFIIWVLVNTFWPGFLYSKLFPHPFIFHLLLCGMFLSPKYRVTMWGMLISELNCQRRWTV